MNETVKPSPVHGGSTAKRGWGEPSSAISLVNRVFVAPPSVPSRHLPRKRGEGRIAL